MGRARCFFSANRVERLDFRIDIATARHISLRRKHPATRNRSALKHLHRRAMAIASRRNQFQSKRTKATDHGEFSRAFPDQKVLPIILWVPIFLMTTMRTVSYLLNSEVLGDGKGNIGFTEKSIRGFPQYPEEPRLLYNPSPGRKHGTLELCRIIGWFPSARGNFWTISSLALSCIMIATSCDRTGRLARHDGYAILCKLSMRSTNKGPT